jgi:hypothetical protein
MKPNWTLRNSSAHSASARSYYSGSRGVAKAAWYGSTSGGGFRGGGNHYYHNFYHGYNRGYHGWGAYSPYWAIGSYLTSLPDDYTTYYDVDGDPYYYSDGSYFAPYSNGYMVIPAPDLSNATTPGAMAPTLSVAEEQPMMEQPKPTSSGPITINIPNSKGGYIGPQGEYYGGHPTIDELKALYGD